jgi:hypothetical protein
VQWGPAVNLAVRKARGEFVFYVCSNEGIVARPGWERACLHFLRANRDVALAGHLISSPAFPTGESYRDQPWFSLFRNKWFAEHNSEREFFHVQGGLFVLRREAFLHCGELSALVRQEAADIEYSYFLESCGWGLGAIPNLPSLTKKTLPPLCAHLDENTLAAHPLTRADAEHLDCLVTGRVQLCNLCGWYGERFDTDEHGRKRCPACDSTPFGRTAYRYIAASNLPYRKLRCLVIAGDESLQRELRRMFALEALDGWNGAMAPREQPYDLVLADLYGAPPGEAVAALARAVSPRGRALLGIDLSQSGESGDDVVEPLLREVGFQIERVSFRSRVVWFEHRDVLACRRTGGVGEAAAPPAAGAMASVASRQTAGVA